MRPMNAPWWQYVEAEQILLQSLLDAQCNE